LQNNLQQAIDNYLQVGMMISTQTRGSVMKKGTAQFEEFLCDSMHKYEYEAKNFTGDIIDLTDQHKDELCYQWLKAMPSWRDDYLPLSCHDQEKFLDHLYLHSKAETLSIKMRDDIYMGLESTLEDIINGVYARYYKVPEEEFQGYARGQ
jgi:hypothetical protein